MSQGELLSIIESPAHPDFSALYRRLGYSEQRVNSQRKAMALVKKRPPQVIVAEFIYGWGNNYAGINKSNLDILLIHLARYAPRTRVIVLVTKDEWRFVDESLGHLPLQPQAVLQLPVSETAMEQALAG